MCIRDRGGPRQVRVLVAAHVHPFEAGLAQLGQQHARLPVVGPARDLAVRHLQPDAGPPRDLDGLVQRGGQAGALVAHVRRVRHPVPVRHLGQRHQFRRAGVAARRIDEAARQPARPCGEGRRRQLAHPFQVALAQALVEAGHGPAQRRVPDERRHVVGRPGVLDGVQVLGERPVGHVLAGQLLQRGGGGGVGEAAVAVDLGGDALEQLERLRPRHQRHQVGVRVGVHEPGGHRQPGRVDHPARVPEVAAHLHHPVAGDGDIAHDGRRAETVVHRSATQDEIGHAHHPTPTRAGNSCGRPPNNGPGIGGPDEDARGSQRSFASARSRIHRDPLLRGACGSRGCWL